MKKLLTACTMFSFLFISTGNVWASPQLNVSGKILLQVEDNGEAWYVNPETQKRHFLSRPAQAYQLMREEGIGITNRDIEKIPVGFYQLSGTDSDQDGLVDDMEKALGTDPNRVDTDEDGHSDRTELTGFFNPLGVGNLPLDSSFTTKQLGKIFLQVESHGEAWWVNPDDHLRYYLGRADDAFALMRGFGLGITTANLNTIPVAESLLDCGDDLACLISALEQDQLAKVDWKITLNIFGTMFETVNATEISQDGSDYVMHALTKSITIKFEEQALQEYLAEGHTQEEADALEAEQSQEQQESVGTKSRCTFPNKTNILTYLRQATDGHYSSRTDESGSFVRDADTHEDLGECKVEN